MLFATMKVGVISNRMTSDEALPVSLARSVGSKAALLPTARGYSKSLELYILLYSKHHYLRESHVLCMRVNSCATLIRYCAAVP
jgi:hypothetical protein